MKIFTVFWNDSKRAASFTNYQSAHGLFMLLKSADMNPVMGCNTVAL